MTPARQGWPAWKIVKDRNGETTTLGRLIYHLRNAASHRRLKFSSDEPNSEKVDIEFEDALPGKPVDWQATIRASDLRAFCNRFSQSLENLVS